MSSIHWSGTCSRSRLYSDQGYHRGQRDRVLHHIEDRRAGDGEIEPRVHLIGPIGRRTLALAKLAEHDWVEADRVQLKAGSSAELASIPAFTTSTIYLVAGLLLPIWKRIPQKSTRVYRLQTDAGERIIGRKVPLSWVTAMSGGETGARS